MGVCTVWLLCGEYLCTESLHAHADEYPVAGSALASQDAPSMIHSDWNMAISKIRIVNKKSLKQNIDHPGTVYGLLHIIGKAWNTTFGNGRVCCPWLLALSSSARTHQATFHYNKVSWPTQSEIMTQSHDNIFCFLNSNLLRDAIKDTPYGYNHRIQFHSLTGKSGTSINSIGGHNSSPRKRH